MSLVYPMLEYSTAQYRPEQVYTGICKLVQLVTILADSGFSRNRLYVHVCKPYYMYELPVLENPNLLGLLPVVQGMYVQVYTGIRQSSGTVLQHSTYQDTSKM